jgi:hypothetical protein
LSADVALLTPRIQDLKAIDPAMSSRISLIPWGGAQGVERSQLTVPLTTTEQVTDTTIFEDPQDPSQKYFVIRYVVDEEATTRGTQAAVRMLTMPNGWELTVTIRKQAPAEILAAHPSAQPVPEQRAALLLRYKQRVNGQPAAYAEAAFTATVSDGEVVRGRLVLSNTAKRDELYAALTDPELACTLIVRLQINVAVPAPSAPTSPPVPPSPRVVAAAVEEPVVRDHRELQPNVRDHRLSQPIVRDHRSSSPIVRDHRSSSPIVRDHRSSPPIVRDHRDSPPIVRDHRDSPPIVRDHRDSDIPAGPAPDPGVPPESQPPAAPRFRQTDRVLDLQLPFTFDPALHGYVYEGIGAVSPGASQGLVRRQIAWEGVSHVYYQDDGQRNVFYYLPDTFKIARRPVAPHEPILGASFASEDGSRDKIEVTFSYCAVPVVNKERLSAVLSQVKALVPGEVLAASGGVVFEPLLPDPAKVKLKLAYPGAATSDGPFAIRPAALVDLRAGIVDALQLSIVQFEELFEAMLAFGSLHFTGAVAFDMGGTGEEIPFQLRLHDTAEPFAKWTHQAIGGDTEVSVTNDIESVLRVHHLDAIVDGDTGPTVVPLAPVESSYPVAIAPATTARFHVAGSASGTLADIDLSDVEMIPDRRLIADIIVDPSAPPEYDRPIKVRTFVPVFAPPPDDAQRQVLAIAVDFENGAGVELTPEKLEGTVTVVTPLTDFLLRSDIPASDGTGPSQAYRYKLTVARLSGITTDTEWRTGESSVLFIHGG